MTTPTISAPQIRKAELNGSVLLGARQLDFTLERQKHIWVVALWTLDVVPTNYIVKNNEILDPFPANPALASLGIHPSAEGRADTLPPEISAFILKTVAEWERESKTN